MSGLFQAVDKVFESGNITRDLKAEKEKRFQTLKEAVERKRLMKLNEANTEKAKLGKVDKGE